MVKVLTPGQIAPRFKAPVLDGNPNYTFDVSAGRWQVLLLLGSAKPESGQAALRLVAENRALFDDRRACFFGVTINKGDADHKRIAKQLPGIRWFLDYDHQISTLYRALQDEGGGPKYHPHWLLLDPMQRVRRVASLRDGPVIFEELRRRLDAPLEVTNAPVLVVPNVVPPELCRHLISLYEEHGGEESGFMREENGVTVGKMDHSHKRRSDYSIKDRRVVDTLRAHIQRSLFPMIRHAFQFEVNRIERFIVSCYDAEVGGHFRPHRDNTTKGTAHRRFACTINLNPDEYEGGDIRFPEFGPQAYRAPTGGAVIFSCSMLHEALPVTKGRRYAFLPFLYDDEGARIREANLQDVAPEYRYYQSGLEAAQA